MWIDHKSPRQKKVFPKYYIRYIARHRHSILPRRHTRINTTKYSRKSSTLQCIPYCMKYKYIHRTIHLYKKDTYYIHGYYLPSTNHPKTNNHPKTILHPKYKTYPKYAPRPKHIPSSHPKTKLHPTPRWHSTYKPHSKYNTYQKTNPHPKSKVKSRYKLHPKRQRRYNLYKTYKSRNFYLLSTYKSPKTIHTQLKNKTASAYRPRHNTKIKHQNTNKTLLNIKTNHLLSSKSANIYLQLEKTMPTLPNLANTTKSTHILFKKYTKIKTIPYHTITYCIKPNILQNAFYNIKHKYRHRTLYLYKHGIYYTRLPITTKKQHPHYTTPKPKPKSRTHSKYNIHPQPHSKHNYHTRRKPKQPQYTQPHNKKASA